MANSIRRTNVPLFSERGCQDWILRLLFALVGCASFQVQAHEDAFPQLLETVKTSIVGIGTHQATRRPPNELLGSGFVIPPGNLVVTNAHVIDRELDADRRERLAIFAGHGRQPDRRFAQVVARDERHDIAILKFEGEKLPAMKLADDELQTEGTAIAFTGFPIGSVLGLYPATHRGIISAHTPVIEPPVNSRQISARDIKFLRDPYTVLQLDTIAFPGNSGSPVYRVSDGAVVGIINKVFVQGTKEDALRHPSAITYAIPVRYLRTLMKK